MNVKKIIVGGFTFVALILMLVVVSTQMGAKLPTISEGDGASIQSASINGDEVAQVNPALSSEFYELSKAVTQLASNQKAFQAMMEQKFHDLEKQNGEGQSELSALSNQAEKNNQPNIEGYDAFNSKRKSVYEQALESQRLVGQEQGWGQSTVEDMQLKFTQTPELSKGQLASSECGVDLCKFRIVYAQDSTFDDRINFDNHFLMYAAAGLPRATSFVEQSPDGRKVQVFYMARKGTYLPGESSKSSSNQN